MKKRNSKKLGRMIRWQYLKEINTAPCGEGSPYWNWVYQNSPENTFDEFQELPQANPDVLPDENGYQATREILQELVEEVVETLSRRERQVFNGLKNGYTEKEIAAQLGVGREMVKQCRSRIRKKFIEHDTKEAC